MTRSTITRRDFLGGTALSLAAGTSLPAYQLLAASSASASPTDYPPALTGLRGSHPGSFEVSHALAWGRRRWDSPASQADATYDLVVVGGGLSGLASAWYYRKQNPDARILILENHDDFGGHARRNEFVVDGHQLIGYGGSQSMENPHSYSPQAMYENISLDFPVSMGQYQFSKNPDKPVVANIPWMPAAHLAVGEKAGRELFREG